MRRSFISLGVALLLTGAALTATTPALTATTPAPPAAGARGAVGAVGAVDPADFSNPQPNPYFPLRPGTVSRYRGSEDGERFTERVTVTRRTKVIQGVTTTVVRDVLRRANGTVAEKTQDWYAADNGGNVWYFGEATATYGKHGRLISREGSWQAGVGGAVAGTIMPAGPKPTDAYRQEFFRGHAEDQAWIVARHATVKVPYGKLRAVVRSYEWTRLEPGVLSLKFYAPGLGIVRERDVAGGNERFDLVAVSHT
jgi:hypothetical protein